MTNTAKAQSMFKLIKATSDYRKDYYGVTGEHFYEILDDHPIVRETLLHEKINYTISGEKRLSGSKQRMLLKGNHNKNIVILRTRTKVCIGDVEIVCMKMKNQIKQSISMLSEILYLASFRWPHGHVYVNSTKVIPETFEMLTASGWELKNQDGKIYATKSLQSL